MLIAAVTRAWEALIHPTIRLKADFPWGVGTMVKQYLVCVVLYLIGSLAPIYAFLAAVTLADKVNPAIVNGWVGPDPGHPRMMVFVVLGVASFICGFGLQVLYIRECFHSSGLTLRRAMALNLDSLGGSWWAAIWRALLACALVLVANAALSLLPLPQAYDPGAEFLKKLHGSGFLIIALLVVLVAPLVEEVVFRGFLFNVCRTSFRKGWLWRVFRSSETMADWAAIGVSAAVFAAGHMTLTGFPALFVMGAICAALYRRSGTLVCPMLLHAFNNLLGVAAIYMVQFAT